MPRIGKIPERERKKILHRNSRKIPRAFWWSKFLADENFWLEITNLKFEEQNGYEFDYFGPKSRDCDSSIRMNLHIFGGEVLNLAWESL